MADARPKHGSSRAVGDGSGEEGVVFDFHGKRVVYPKTSLCVLGDKNGVRAACVRLVTHPWFDRFVLLVIMLNSVVLALVDWRVVDEDPSSDQVGEPVAEGSWRNALLYETEPFFTALFSFELALKIVAQGFVLGRGTYLRDPWNVLDFVVVATALLASVPGVPKTSAVRVFRVLRPLRSVSALPGLQRLVVSLLKSVPQLVSVVILLQFIFLVFGIFGVQVFAGKQHSRCRLTPYPVTTDFEIGMNYADYRCLDVSNFNTPLNESWSRSSSPWSTPRACWWPLDSEDTRLCAFDSTPGKHKCEHDPRYTNDSNFRWCGSDFDAFGNRRFLGGVIGGVEYSAARLAANATFVEDLAWGYTTFDNIFVAFLTIFQSITLEGWSDVLYQVKDCSLPIVADLFFVILILWGAFFTLNLLLAILEYNFQKGKDEVAVARKKVKVGGDEDDDDAVIGAAAEERAIAAEQKAQEATTAGSINGAAANQADNMEGGRGPEAAWENKWEGGGSAGSISVSSGSSCSSSSRSSEEMGHGQYRSGWRLALMRLVESLWFRGSVMAIIVLNTLVLAMDRYPMNDDYAAALEACNVAFTLCFALEMLVRLVALGPREYAKDKINVFDAVIVVGSLIELAVSPPNFFYDGGGAGSDAGGGLSALRSFRVFRVFKFVRGSNSMQSLLRTLRDTLLDVGNFGLLLLLFMFVYALIGVQFFANRLHFADDGRAVGIGEEGYYDAAIPRSNFDTLLHAFVTVFEVLTGENWNNIMYSARRAVGLVSVLYFVTLITLGMMIVMSLFLALLLSHFASPKGSRDDAAHGLPQEQHLQQHEQRQKRRQRAIGAVWTKHEGGHGWEGGGEGSACGAGDSGGPAFRKINNTSQLQEDAESDNGSEPGSDDEDNVSPATAASRALARADSAASAAAPWSSVRGGSFDADEHGGSMEGVWNAQREQRQPPSGDGSSDVEQIGDDEEDGGKGGGAAAATSRTSNAAAAKEGGAGGAGFLARARAVAAKFWPGAVRSVRAPENLYPGLALCFLSAKNPLRRGCAAVASNAGFDRFITLLIVVSSVSVAVDSPLRDPDSAVARALYTVELVTTVLFAAEFAIKVCAFGFFFMPLAYLRDSWNALDFCVVAISVSQLLLSSGPNLVGLRSLRALRALRPLRMINRLPGLKLVLEALLHSVPGVANVAAVCFLFYLVFAVLCVNYFKGVLMSCQGDAFDALPGAVSAFLEQPRPWAEMTPEQRAWFGPLSNVSTSAAAAAFAGSADECVEVSRGLWPDSAGCCFEWPSSPREAPTSLEVCECLGLSWGETIPQSFNNAGVALLTLFEISTTEAWTSVTYAAVDSTSVDMQPIRNNVMARVWFFILFMLIGAYLMVNLFVGVVVDNFKRMKARVEGGLLMTENQRSWMKTRMIMRRLTPMKRRRPPHDPAGAWCFRLIHRRWFVPAVMVCIVLNTLVMAMEYFGQSATYTRVLEWLNIIFFIIFALEALVKIFALRVAYFEDLWNRFDFFIVIGSFAGMLALWLVEGSSYGSVVTVIRVFRVGRVFRLVRGLENVVQLFNTLLMTIPSLGNVGSLLFLLFFIYAAMGVQLFAKVGLEGAVTSQANFRSFWDAMLLLLRFSTGENWNGFMYDMAASRDGCVSDPEYDPDVCGFASHPSCVPLNGCGSWFIFPYMVSFTFTITFVFLNLFVGVILDGFDTAKEESEDLMTKEDFERFAKHWATFDPHATGFISVRDLHAFLQTLCEPWGFGVDHHASYRELRNKVRRLNLHVFDGNRVHFKDVLHALCEEVHRAEAEKKGEPVVHLEESFKTTLPTTGSWRQEDSGFAYLVNPISRGSVTLDQILAVEFLQQAFRHKRAQREKLREAGSAEENTAAESKGRGSESNSDDGDYVASHVDDVEMEEHLAGPQRGRGDSSGLGLPVSLKSPRALRHNSRARAGSISLVKAAAPPAPAAAGEGEVKEKELEERAGTVIGRRSAGVGPSSGNDQEELPQPGETEQPAPKFTPSGSGTSIGDGGGRVGSRLPIAPMRRSDDAGEQKSGARSVPGMGGGIGVDQQGRENLDGPQAAAAAEAAAARVFGDVSVDGWPPAARQGSFRESAHAARNAGQNRPRARRTAVPPLSSAESPGGLPRILRVSRGAPRQQAQVSVRRWLSDSGRGGRAGAGAGADAGGSQGSGDEGGSKKGFLGASSGFDNDYVDGYVSP